MNAEELLVHDRSEGQCAERVYAGIVQARGILMLTYMQVDQKIHNDYEREDSHSSLNVK